MNKDNKGFSLIELIIVIAIMAILIAVIAPNLTKYLSKSKTSTDTKNLDELEASIQTCITDYETDNGDLLAAAGDTLKVTVSSDDKSWECSSNTTFAACVNETITKTVKSKVNSSQKAAVTITKKDSGGYEVKAAFE